MTNELKIKDQSNVSRKKRSNNTNNEDTQRTKYWFRLRLIPIWLRVVILLLLWFLITIIGLMIGFGVLGDGNPLDVLDWDTWQHIFNIMDGKI